MPRIQLISGNWKMYKTGEEAAQTAKRLVELISDVIDVDIMIAPAFTALSAVYSVVAGTRVALGAQNLFWENEGAYTGEISGPMIKSMGCSHVIIGHSERRQYFGETDETVNKKIRAAVSSDLVPVFCVGETEKQRDAEETFSVLDKQLRSGLKGLSLNDPGALIIAYEPVWAIGTGKTASKNQAQEVHRFLRDLIEKLYGEKFSGAVRILYGGSVKPANIKELMAMPDIDGALVGGASLDAETFSQIIHFH